MLSHPAGSKVNRSCTYLEAENASVRKTLRLDGSAQTEGRKFFNAENMLRPKSARKLTSKHA
jgi:hypothetical protein